jgi:hypothetical protein
MISVFVVIKEKELWNHVDIIIDTIIAKEMTLRDKDELESLMYLNKVNNEIVSIFMEKSFLY